MPLFPFPGRPGIIQGKAGRQTQGGAAAKNLTYYREVRLLLFAVTFRLSGLGIFSPPFSLLLTACPHWKSIFSSLAFVETTKYDFLSSSTRMNDSLSCSLCCLHLCLSLSLSLRHPVLGLVAQGQRL